MKYYSVIIGLLVLFVGSGFSQTISPALCQKIRNEITQRLRPTKIDRDEVYTSECVLEFVIDKTVDASVTIEKFESETASIKAFNDNRSIYCFARNERGGQSCAESEKKDGWDDAFESRSNTNNLLMLRKGDHLITIFSLQHDTILQMEALLRKRRYH